MGEVRSSLIAGRGGGVVIGRDGAVAAAIDATRPTDKR